MAGLWFPRTLYAWLELAKAEGFSGDIPGLDASINNNRVLVNGFNESLDNISRATALIVASTDQASELPELVKAADLSKLGLILRQAVHRQKQRMSKVELPGMSAPALKPEAAKPPAPQTKEDGVLKTEFQYSLAALRKRCDDCGHAQVLGSRFVGCLCLAQAAATEGVSMRKSEGSYFLKTTQTFIDILGTKIHD